MLALIVLAAGKSARTQDRNKLLTDIDGKPMIRRVVETAISSNVDEVIVVLGFEAEKVQNVLADLPCRLILNENYELGQSSSVKVGLAQVASSAKAVLILPGDIAKIDSRSINTVIDSYHRTNSSIVVAAYEGRMGHPILLDSRLFTEIQNIDEKTFGLKSVIKNHQSEVRLVETRTENVLKDVDTLEDLSGL